MSTFQTAIAAFAICYIVSYNMCPMFTVFTKKEGSE